MDTAIQSSWSPFDLPSSDLNFSILENCFYPCGNWDLRFTTQLLKPFSFPNNSKKSFFNDKSLEELYPDALEPETTDPPSLEPDPKPVPLEIPLPLAPLAPKLDCLEPDPILVVPLAPLAPKLDCLEPDPILVVPQTVSHENDVQPSVPKPPATPDVSTPQSVVDDQKPPSPGPVVLSQKETPRVINRVPTPLPASSKSLKVSQQRSDTLPRVPTPRPASSKSLKVSQQRSDTLPRVPSPRPVSSKPLKRSILEPENQFKIPKLCPPKPSAFRNTPVNIRNIFSESKAKSATWPQQTPINLFREARLKSTFSNKLKRPQPPDESSDEHVASPSKVQASFDKPSSPKCVPSTSKVSVSQLVHKKKCFAPPSTFSKSLFWTPPPTIPRPPKESFWTKKPTYYERKLQNRKLPPWPVPEETTPLKPVPEETTPLKPVPEETTPLKPVPQETTPLKPVPETSVGKNSPPSNFKKPFRVKPSKAETKNIQPDCDILILDIADESDLEDYLMDYTPPDSPWFDEHHNPQQVLTEKKKTVPQKLNTKSSKQARKTKNNSPGPVRFSRIRE